MAAAQNSVSPDVEIQRIEKEISGQEISSAQKHDALIRLAQLRQLSGDIEGAAKNWLEAAAAEQGKIDDDALLSCAYCLAAMGEWDRAGIAVEPLLAKSERAKFLDASIKAIKSGDVSALTAIANNTEYSQIKSQTYFMLWKMSGVSFAETWKQRLLAEFPQSPEGRIASGENTSLIMIKTSPFWLFIGGLDSLFPADTAAASSPAAEIKNRIVTPSPPADKPVIQKTSSAAEYVRLQTGVFKQKDNAETQMVNLRKAGFSPFLDQRNDLWAVTVLAGSDTNRTIAELKNAGFDSFPIR
jgi:hypothetical protein